MADPGNKDDKATIQPLPGDAARTSASAPLSAKDPHPTIREHQDNGGSGGMAGRSGGRQSGEQPARLKDQARQTASKAGSKARSAAEEGKSKASETIKNVAASTRDAASQFEDTQAAPLTSYVNSAADRIEQFGNTIDEKSVDELLDDLREMVRRSPAIAVGAATAVGFALSRFAKATDHGSSGGGQMRSDRQLGVRAGDTPPPPATPPRSGTTTRYDV